LVVVSGDKVGAVEQFFDEAFLDELEGLAKAGEGHAPALPEVDLHARLAAFLGPPQDSHVPLDAGTFQDLPEAVFRARTDILIETCRESPRRGAVEDVENFVVFIQALIPTLATDSAKEIKRAFFRLAPTLLHIAYHDFSGHEAEREEGRDALQNLENILLEISSVRLAPSEGDLVFKSIDQIAALIDSGAYDLANQLVSTRLLALIRKNKVTRALYRLMEVEVNVQRYLKERLGYSTPQIRIPEDLVALEDYGPVRVLHEDAIDGEARTYLQFQLPELPLLRDFVLTLVREEEGGTHEARLDNLGCVALEVPPGTYRMGLVYQPES
jgi:hypothetical protein